MFHQLKYRFLFFIKMKKHSLNKSFWKQYFFTSKSSYLYIYKKLQVLSGDCVFIIKIDKTSCTSIRKCENIDLYKLKYIYIQGSAENFIGWPRYFHGMWLNELYFFSIVSFTVHSVISFVLQCLQPINKNVNNSIYIYIYIYIYTYIYTYYLTFQFHAFLIKWKNTILVHKLLKSKTYIYIHTHTHKHTHTHTHTYIYIYIYIGS